MIDSTATGIDADTVMPTLSTRYSDEAPKMMPSTAPTSTAGQVNSGITTLSGTCGSCGTGPLLEGTGTPAVLWVMAVEVGPEVWGLCPRGRPSEQLQLEIQR